MMVIGFVRRRERGTAIMGQEGVGLVTAFEGAVKMCPVALCNRTYLEQTTFAWKVPYQFPSSGIVRWQFCKVWGKCRITFKMGPANDSKNRSVFN